MLFQQIPIRFENKKPDMRITTKIKGNGRFFEIRYNFVIDGFFKINADMLKIPLKITTEKKDCR
jgi:hypothetical protein